MTELNLEGGATYTLGIEVDPDSLRAAKSFLQRFREVQQDATRIARKESERRIEIVQEYVQEVLEEYERYSERISAMRGVSSDGFTLSSREERLSTRSMGTEGAEELARQGDLLSAQRAGFDRYFGGGERQTIETAEIEKSRLQLQVKAKREYVVKVEEDVDQLVSRIAEQIETQLEEREQVIMWRLNKRLADFVANRSH